MPYYHEGRRYLPEVSDRAADYPEPPKIVVNRNFDRKKAEKLTSEVQLKKKEPMQRRITDITEKWLERERYEKLRTNFYNNLKR